MAAITRVYLITGFLGAGKTTLLNRIIKRFPKDKKLTLLVNEFGEIGVDGTLVEGDDIDMMEISKGSIFCVCVKTDFIKGLYELNTKVKPDVLLIESTGVANPSDLKKDLKLPIFNDRFDFKDQFCVIDAVHFMDAYDAFASIEKQIASSSVFIINKTDLAPEGTIDKIKDIVARFHPAPLFFETTYGDIPLERFFELDAATIASDAAPDTAPVLTTEQLERFIDDLLDSPDLEITPPDTLVSTAYQWQGSDIAQVRDLAANLPKAVVRAKGFIQDDSDMHIFNYVMGTWTIEPSPIPVQRISHPNIVVLIGPPESMDGIAKAAATGNWKAFGVYQPFQGSQ